MEKLNVKNTAGVSLLPVVVIVMRDKATDNWVVREYETDVGAVLKLDNPQHGFDDAGKPCQFEFVGCVEPECPGQPCTVLRRLYPNGNGTVVHEAAHKMETDA
jgi:hypothetical protein